MVDPTCTVEGLTQGSHCEKCGKVIIEQTKIPAHGHDIVQQQKKDATCEEDGMTEGAVCKICHESISGCETLPKLGHVEVIDESVSADCHHEGLTEGSHCERCGKTLVEQTVIPYAHNVVIDPAIDATCSKIGKTEGSHCSLCNTVLVEQKNIIIPHEYEDGKCINCGLPTPTETLRFSYGYYEDYYGYFVTGISSNEETDIVVPLTYNDEEVVGISSEAFKNNQVINSIYLPPSIKVIRTSAFEKCTNLKKIVFAGEIDTIDDFSFYDCSNVSTIKLAGIDTISQYAFQGFGNKLSEVYYTGSIIDWAKSSLGAYFLKNSNDYHPKKLYINDTLVTSLNLDNAQTITDYAFYGLPDITEIYIPNTVTSIGANAFDKLEGLTTIRIANTTNEIENLTVSSDKLTKFKFDGTLEEYLNCDAVGSINWLYRKNGMHLYINDDELINLVVPDGTTSIRYNAFDNCSYLESVSLPESIVEINDSAFRNCVNISEINLPNNLLEISPYTFENCTKLVNITIGKNVKKIYYSAFDDCNIQKINIYDNIPEYVAYGDDRYNLNGAIYNYLGTIDSWAENDNLGEFYFKDATYTTFTFNGKMIENTITLTTATKVAKYAFYPFYIHTFNLPSTLKVIETDGFKQKYNPASGQIFKMATINYDGTINEYLDTNIATFFSNNFYVDKIMLKNNDVTLLDLEGVSEISDKAFYHMPSIKTINIYPTLKKIGASVFNEKIAPTINFVGTMDEWVEYENIEFFKKLNNSSATFTINGEEIKDVVLTSATKINPYAFSDTNLSSITISDTVTEIGASAFEGCYKLTKIEIPSSVKVIKKDSFKDCSSLKSLTLNEGLTNVEDAFDGCSNLVNVTIPKSIEDAALNLFAELPTELNIHFLGTLDDWLDSKVQESLRYYKNGSTYYQRSNNLYINNELLSELVISTPIIPKEIFFGNQGITSIVINEGVKEIQEAAFANCTNVKTIIFNTVVDKIGEKSFYNMKNLESVDIRAKTIDTNAFGYNPLLKTVKISDETETIDSEAFGGTTMIKDLTIFDVKNIYTDSINVDYDSIVKYQGTLSSWAESTLPKCLNEGRVILSIDGKEIDELDFRDAKSVSIASMDCSNKVSSLTISKDTVIEEGTIPYAIDVSIKTIDFIGTPSDWVKTDIMLRFNYYKKLLFNGESIKEAILTDVTSIPSKAFVSCPDLEKVTIPIGVESIGEYAFNGCSLLTDIDFPSTAKSVPSNLLWYIKHTFNVNFLGEPDDWVNNRFYELFNYGYDANSRLNEKTYHLIFNSDESGSIKFNNISEIKDYSFEGASGIKVVDLSNITKLGDYAFARCPDLEKVILSEDLTQTSQFSFAYDGNLVEVVFGKNIKTIGDYSFYECKKLNIEIPASIEEIGREAFRKCYKLKQMVISPNLKSIGIAAFSDIGLFEAVINFNQVDFSGDFHYGSKVYFNGGTIDDWAESPFPAKFTSYGVENLYINNVLVTDVVINNAQIINNGAFSGSKHTTSVVIGDSVTRIGDYAFMSLLNLTTVTLGDNITYLGDRAFNKSKITTITLPKNLEEIGDYAFYECSSLVTINMSNKVKTIANYAFSRASSNLTINYDGTIEEFNLITTATGWGSVKTVVCLDGTFEIK